AKMGFVDKTFKTIVFIAFVVCLGRLCMGFNASFGGKAALIAFLAGILGWAILYFGFYLLLSPLEFFTTAPAILYLTRVIGTPIGVLWCVFWGTTLLGGPRTQPAASQTTNATNPTLAVASAIPKAIAVPSPSVQTYRVMGVR